MLAPAALIGATLFTGAALYVSIAEHPARMQLDDAAALAQWKPSYARGAVMQASLALFSGLAALLAWWRWQVKWEWLVAGIAMLANLPYTFLAIWSLNTRLELTPIEAASADTRALLERWGRLHAVRSALGVIATAMMSIGLFD